MTTINLDGDKAREYAAELRDMVRCGTGSHTASVLVEVAALLDPAGARDFVRHPCPNLAAHR